MVIITVIWCSCNIINLFWQIRKFDTENRLSTKPSKDGYKTEFSKSRKALVLIPIQRLNICFPELSGVWFKTKHFFCRRIFRNSKDKVCTKENYRKNQPEKLEKLDGYKCSDLQSGKSNSNTKWNNRGVTLNRLSFSTKYVYLTTVDNEKVLY